MVKDLSDPKFDNARDIWARLEKSRLALGLSKRAVSLAAEREASYYYASKRNLVIPPYSVLVKMSKILKMPLSEMVGKEQSPEIERIQELLSNASPAAREKAVSLLELFLESPEAS